MIREELGEDADDDDADSYREKIRKLHLERGDGGKAPEGGPSAWRSRRPARRRRRFCAIIWTPCLELPWNKTTKERLDVAQARKILDADHYGLEKVKERILETLAVRQLAPELPGQILCLVGPPGVGKTSIADLHCTRAQPQACADVPRRRTRRGGDPRPPERPTSARCRAASSAAVSHAGSKNALLLLDEIDKLGSDYKGDPASALLEVLDSEQNSSFRDHYLEVPFDLHECMFITTANTTDTIPRALLDRMEVIEIGSYTDEEKLQIAKRHLLPKQLEKHGLPKGSVRVSEDALREIIACYTRESGVRNLERELAALCRKCAMRLVEPEAPKRISVTGANLERYLGVRKFLPDELPANDQVGLVDRPRVDLCGR